MQNALDFSRRGSTGDFPSLPPLPLLSLSLSPLCFLFFSSSLVCFARFFIASSFDIIPRRLDGSTGSTPVQYKLALNSTTGSRKSLTFPSEVSGDSQEKDVCRPRYFCRIALPRSHARFVLNSLRDYTRAKTRSMLIQFEFVFNSISESGAFDFPPVSLPAEESLSPPLLPPSLSPSLFLSFFFSCKKEKCVDVCSSYFSSLF